MVKAKYNDKKMVTDILVNSFLDNPSVNYLIPKNKNSISRIRAMMDYSFEVCYQSGDIFLSEDRKGCALVSYPDLKKSSFRAIALDLKLIVKSIGIWNIRKALHRATAIKKHYPPGATYYLWFIGVDADAQHRGTGTRLLNELIADAQQKKRPIYLETSVPHNVKWYEKHGFEVYKSLYFNYTLFLIKREFQV